MPKVDNKKIAKNTLFLYIRMIVVLGISLYTVRAILDILGVVDYGIYNVVGGMVSMFAFVKNTLATSSQRYFSVEMEKGDVNQVNKWFCLNVTAFSIFILGFIVIAETLGLWFVNTQMTIPVERLNATNIVYQFSIAAFCVNFISIPYTALIIAHERMSAFAYISILEAVSKLLIVLLLTIIKWDKLVVYSILMFLSSCGITISYIIYNRVHFIESKFKPYWDKNKVTELVGFSSWHFLGTFSTVIRSQGINILINIFFNPVMNAARALAFQVYGAIEQLSNNFFTAVKPQIYKTYANNEYDEMRKLIMRSTIICSFLISILVFPLLANTKFVLGLWLKEMPSHTVLFTQLVLINGLIDSTGGPTFAAALATKKIKNFMIIVSSVVFLNLPISYIALKFGAEASVTMLISIIISLITALIRAYLLRLLIKLSFRRYLYMFMRLMVSHIVMLCLIFFIAKDSVNNLLDFILYSMFFIGVTIMIYVTFVFDKRDVLAIKKFIHNDINIYRVK